VYVKEQMGHSSTQIVVDVYSCLIPGANVNFVDRLDTETSPQQSSIQAQSGAVAEEAELAQGFEKLVAAVGLEPTT
jgi:hypothetical protein